MLPLTFWRQRLHVIRDMLPLTFWPQRLHMIRAQVVFCLIGYIWYIRAQVTVDSFNLNGCIWYARRLPLKMWTSARWTLSRQKLLARGVCPNVIGTRTARTGWARTRASVRRAWAATVSSRSSNGNRAASLRVTREARGAEMCVPPSSLWWVSERLFIVSDTYRTVSNFSRCVNIELDGVSEEGGVLHIELSKFYG